MKRYAVLCRKKGLKPQSDKVRLVIEPRYRALKNYLEQHRSKGGCEIKVDNNCYRKGQWWHHIIRRSAGKRIDEPWNLIHACNYCHEAVQHDKTKIDELLKLTERLNEKYGIEETWNDV